MGATLFLMKMLLWVVAEALSRRRYAPVSHCRTAQCGWNLNPERFLVEKLPNLEKAGAHPDRRSREAQCVGPNAPEFAGLPILSN
jgi:hypothetical protein